MIPANYFVFGTAALYVLHSVFVKLASGKIDPYSGIFAWCCGSLLAGIVFFLYGKINTETSFSVSCGAFVFFAGIFITTGTLFYLLAFHRNVDFSFATPVVNVSVVMGGLLFGMALFGEPVSMNRIIGVVLGIVSIIFLVRS
ncbi:MAG: EamA family transporter [Alphaproteobacteria bacterium]|nr:EamA family transporter [Alphaproteobacteria bacterium]